MKMKFKSPNFRCTSDFADASSVKIREQNSGKAMDMGRNMLCMNNENIGMYSAIVRRFGEGR